MSLIKSLFTVGFFTFLSRISGYIRDIFIASYLGTSHMADAFSIAFKLPNFFRNIFAEGALNSAFIPIFSGKLASKNKEEAIDFASNVLTILVISLIFLTLLFEIFMPNIMKLLAFGYLGNPEKFNFAILFARISFPYLLFISVTTIFAGILNSFGKFAIASAIPILLNIVMTLSAILLGKHIGSALAFTIGILIAGLVQLVTIVFATYQINIILKLKIPIFDNDIKLMFKKMLPAIIGSSITQINLWVGTIFATSIAGAVTIIYHAERLNQFPMAIIGTALGTILLPTLSRQVRNGEIQQAHDTQTKALEMSLFLTIPSSFGLFILAENIISILLERGHFNSKDTHDVAGALQFLILGLPAFVMNRVLTPRFFASLDTKIPMFTSFVSMFSNISLSYFLMKIMSFQGIVLASAISGWLSVIILSYFLVQKYDFVFAKSLFIKVTKILFASCCMSYSIFFMQNYLKTGFFCLLITIIVGMTIYFVIAFYLKIFNIDLLKQYLKKQK